MCVPIRSSFRGEVTWNKDKLLPKKPPLPRLPPAGRRTDVLPRFSPDLYAVLLDLHNRLTEGIFAF